MTGALELVVLGTDPDAALEVAGATGATAYTSDEARDDLPYRSLVRAVVSDADRLAPAADVGSYLVFAREVRARPVSPPHGEPVPGVVATFALVRHPDLSHLDCDRHWRDVHAPLALRHHVGMWAYTQCSVVRTLDGPSYDGFALCGFASERDLRERFFDGPEGRQAIGDDVASFADTSASPRRVLTTERSFGV